MTQTISTLPSLTELGLLGQPQLWKAWWSASFCDFGRHDTPSCEHSSRRLVREHSPARKRRAISREPDEDEEEDEEDHQTPHPFVSGPLPSPSPSATPRKTAPESQDGSANRRHELSEREPKQNTSKLGHASQGKQTPNTHDEDDEAEESNTTKTKNDTREDDAKDADEDDDYLYEDAEEGDRDDAKEHGQGWALPIRRPPLPPLYFLPLPMPHKPPQRPFLNRSEKTEATLGGQPGTEEQEPDLVRDDDEDGSGDSSAAQQQQWTLHWPPAKRRPQQQHKRKREASPSPQQQLQQHQRQPLRARQNGPAMMPAMRAGAAATAATSATSELYVLYKFDRVDQLGGRRRGSRRGGVLHKRG